jgi:hypothetical protein
MDNDERHAELVKACIKLREHFDSVQIFAGRVDEELDCSVTYQAGKGSWYERYGIVREWIVKQEHRARVSIQMEDKASEEEEGPA